MALHLLSGSDPQTPGHEKESENLSEEAPTALNGAFTHAGVCSFVSTKGNLPVLPQLT